ncbi:MAG: SUMF1/EgtB/PvdO family nonheme iron enzyme [Solirubrobacteraceae bacterium]|nr:SUMF1/EgtB/PvdO family nonheme iron enzyme [Solirubrobacteraceae bacterium]
MHPTAVTSELHHHAPTRPERERDPAGVDVDRALPSDDPGPHRQPLPADPVAAMLAVRRRTLALVDGIPRDALERQVDPRMSPLVWDLAHVAAFEDLWLVHRHGGGELLRPDLAALYDAFETPRATRGDLDLLDLPGALRYLDDVRERALDATDRCGVDPRRHELVLRHELQHTETMLQAMALAGLRPHLTRPPRGAGGPLRLVEMPGGRVPIGTDDGVDGQRFAYDNERPRHHRTLAPYRIASRPLSVGDQRAFAADGGYDDRRWWGDDGWAWRRDPDRAPHRPTGSPDPGPPADAHDDDVACHLSWFEARALCRHRGLRLPTEAEWEHAAAVGVLDDVGAAWEWTATTFDGYPGFVADPYPEYSEVFFDRGMPVLRGGSFAAHPRVATTTFRNWDLPRRCQLFAGVRPAGDVA